MTLSRPVWISIAAVSAILVVAGTVWWLRTRSVNSLAVLRTTEQTPENAVPATPPPPNDQNTDAVVKASDEIVNRPVFFAPEPKGSPGINIGSIVYSDTPSTSTEAVTPSPTPTMISPTAPAAPPQNSGGADTDGDGLTNDQESQLGSDPTKKDSDGDTLSDGDEVKKYRTDPNKADSDGDRYTDAEEIKNGYNPVGTGKCLTSDCVF